LVRLEESLSLVDFNDGHLRPGAILKIVINFQIVPDEYVFIAVRANCEVDVVVFGISKGTRCLYELF